MTYILRGKGMGEKSMPEVAAMLGVDVHKSDTAPVGHDLVFRWGCTSLDLGQTKVVNKAGAIKEVAEKATFRKKLADNGLAPVTFLSFEDYLESGNLTNLAPHWIIRPEHHQRSQDLYLATKPSEVYQAWQKVGKGYISEYIEKTQEFRVFVVSGRIAWMLEKTPKNKSEVSWGCVQDGNFNYLGWSEFPKEVSKVALAAMNLTPLDFGAVDVIVKDGRAYVMEINTAPWLSSYPTLVIAKCFKYIMKHGKDHLGLVTDWSWQNVVHPAAQIKKLEGI